MTFRELRDFLNDLTDEQLEQTATVIGVEAQGGPVVQADILDEDWVDDGEAPCPRSVWDENKEPDAEEPAIVWAKGDVQLTFEPLVKP